MGKNSLIILIFLLMSGLVSNAQKSYDFFGKLGSSKDTVLYYFNDNKGNLKIVTCDESGKYFLSIKSVKDSLITFYYKESEYCLQTLNLNKIRKQNKILKNNKIQNDLSLLKGFACVRTECYMPDDNMKYMGVWTNSEKLILEIDCYYKREFIQNGLKYIEEGNCNIVDKKIQLESVYIKNVETGTYEEIERKMILNIENDKLISKEDGTTYYKK